MDLKIPKARDAAKPFKMTLNYGTKIFIFFLSHSSSQVCFNTLANKQCHFSWHTLYDPVCSSGPLSALPTFTLRPPP